MGWGYIEPDAPSGDSDEGEIAHNKVRLGETAKLNGTIAASIKSQIILIVQTHEQRQMTQYYIRCWSIPKIRRSVIQAYP